MAISLRDQVMGSDHAQEPSMKLGRSPGFNAGQQLRANGRRWYRAVLDRSFTI